MKYRQLGTTDLNLSEVAFGVWSVSTGWWGHVDKPDAIRLLQDAQEMGVNFFDTADTYAQGYGEEIMREALGKSRKDVIIGTKFGYDLEAPREGHKERPQKWDSEFIRAACESSLQRMGTDYIDLYQLHNPRVGTVQDDAVFETLGDLVREGKVRHVGIALGPDIGWVDEGETAMRERNISSLQVIYSIIEQQPARQFFPIAGEQKTGLLARVPHASEDGTAGPCASRVRDTDRRIHGQGEGRVRPQ